MMSSPRYELALHCAGAHLPFSKLQTHHIESTTQMKSKLIAMTIVCAALPALAADTYQIGPDKSKVRFTIMNKAPGQSAAEEVPGSFGDFKGTAMFNAQDPAKSSVQMEIKTASIETGIARRDDHLRSADFFKVKEFPTMTFKSTAAKKTSEDTYEVTGNFTLLGKTKPVTATFKKTGDEAGTATFKLLRSDYGMKFRIPDTGDEVNVTLELAGTKK
jgi:polyisoprenoid-binding protein YceI